MDKSWYLLLHSTTWLPIPATEATLSMEHRQGLVRLTECGVMENQPAKVTTTIIVIDTEASTGIFLGDTMPIVIFELKRFEKYCLP